MTRYLLLIFVLAALTTSQSATTRTLVPIGLSIGLPVGPVVATVTLSQGLAARVEKYLDALTDGESGLFSARNKALQTGKTARDRRSFR